MKKFNSTWTRKTLKNEYAAMGSSTWTRKKVVTYTIMNTEYYEL